MDKFTTLTSYAAPLAQTDIDTDLILPARFLLLLERRGIGKYLFHDLRNQRVAKPFVLDRKPYDSACIIVAGPGFGTGSSREQAVWALVDFGIRCIISPQFGEIFHANCIRNGILPIDVGGPDHTRLLEAAERGEQLTVNLCKQEIRSAEGAVISFSIQQDSRRTLLEGLDEIEEIMRDSADELARFETTQRQLSPWLWLSDKQLSSFE